MISLPLPFWAFALGATTCTAVILAAGTGAKPQAPPYAATAPAPHAPVLVDPTAAQSASLLDRPLFSPSRRADLADATPAAATDVATSLPRLTGVLITQGSRRAIFAFPVTATHPTVVTEGGQVGAYRVKSIGLVNVTLAGPTGDSVVTPRFSDAPATLAPPPGIPTYGVSLLPPSQDPARFDTPVGAAGIAMYRYSPAAPHTPPPVSPALTAP